MLNGPFSLHYHPTSTPYWMKLLFHWIRKEEYGHFCIIFGKKEKGNNELNKNKINEKIGEKSEVKMYD